MLDNMQENPIGDRSRVRAVTVTLRNWSFPLVLLVAWMAAVAYTLVVLGVGASPVRAGSPIASPAQVTAAAPVVPVQQQQHARGS